MTSDKKKFQKFQEKLNNQYKEFQVLNIIWVEYSWNSMSFTVI